MDQIFPGIEFKVKPKSENDALTSHLTSHNSQKSRVYSYFYTVLAAKYSMLSMLEGHLQLVWQVQGLQQAQIER